MAIPVSFVSDGLRLLGELHLPESPRPWPGLCICHGIPAVSYDPNDTGYRDLAARFATAGFAALIFHFRGAGLSDGDFDILGWSRDLHRALTLLSGNEGVDTSRLYLIGFSGGAAASIHMAARDERVAAVVSCASPARFDELVNGPALNDCLMRWREIGIIRNPMFPSDLDAWVSGFREVAPIAHIAQIAPRPLLLLHGDADEVVPVSHAYELYEAAGEPKQLEIIPDGAHRLRVDERAMSHALDWLRRHSAS